MSVPPLNVIAYELFYPFCGTDLFLILQIFLSFEELDSHGSSEQKYSLMEGKTTIT